MSNLTRVIACGLGLLLLTSTSARAADEAAPVWNPNAWVEEDTIELRTTAPGKEPHWFKVWFVVIDGQLYVRLGSRAAQRFEENQTRPVIAVRIAGHQFEKITGVPVPDMVGPVATAMGEKHWSDVIVRYFAHPLTLRLVPE